MKNEEQMLILTNDGLFVNSNTVFIEYYDIIKAPWLILLAVLHKNEKLRGVLDIDSVKYIDIPSLLEHYCMRDERNILLDIAYDKDNGIDYDELLEVLMDNESFYTSSEYLNIVPIIKEIIRTSITKHVIVYTEKYSKHVEADILNIFDKKITNYVTGDFKDVLKDVSYDTTFIFSDYNKLEMLYQEKRLDCVSILLPADYMYNYNIVDGEKVPKVDMKKYQESCMYRIGYYLAVLKM